jgi:hypothetical protein
MMLWVNFGYAFVVLLMCADCSLDKLAGYANKAKAKQKLRKPCGKFLLAVITFSSVILFQVLLFSLPSQWTLKFCTSMLNCIVEKTISLGMCMQHYVSFLLQISIWV